MIHLAAAYDLVTGAEESGALELRISKLEDDLWIPISILYLDARHLAGDASRRPRPRRGYTAVPMQLRRSGSTRWPAWAPLTVLLYLAGEPDIVGIVHPGAKPNKESLRRRDPERWRDLAEPNQYAVGKDFTQAI